MVACSVHCVYGDIMFSITEPLVDASVMDGSLPQHDHANADEFIHIFVNNSVRLTQFLEHMVKVRTYSFLNVLLSFHVTVSGNFSLY